MIYLVLILGLVCFALLLICSTLYSRLQQFDRVIAILEDQRNGLVRELDAASQRIEHEMRSWRAVEEKKIRADAVQKSRSIMRGQSAEHLAPFLVLDTNPKDYRFMSNPIDYVVYDGLGELLDGETDQLKRIIFLDIKTGKSDLSTSQRRIRDCVKEGRVEFHTFNPETGEWR